MSHVRPRKYNDSTFEVNNNGVTLSLGPNKNYQVIISAGPVISLMVKTHKLRNMKIWDENDIQ